MLYYKPIYDNLIKTTNSSLLFLNFSFMKNTVTCQDWCVQQDVNWFDIMSLVGYIFFRILFLYGLYRVIKYAFTKVGIDINKVTKTKTFGGFVLVTTSMFSKTLRGFLSTLSVPVKLLLGIDIGDDTKYEGFMSFLERYFLLNRYKQRLTSKWFKQSLIS